MKQWKSRAPKKRRNEGLDDLTKFICGGLSLFSSTLSMIEKTSRGKVNNKKRR